ncbi:MAG: hypothetical protein Aurels2KO_03340 [Aureliella sp.]
MGLALVIVAFVVGIISLRNASSDGSGGNRFGAAMPFWALVYLLITWVTASADRGLVMRPAEIHFLIGGPFPRRDVITLTLVRLAIRAVFGAVFLALVSLTYINSFLSAFSGIWLLICVSLLVGMVVSLASRASQRSWIKNLRRVGSVAAIALLLVMVQQSISLVRQVGPISLSAVAAAAPLTEVGKAVMPPVQWMFAPLAEPRFYPEVVNQMPLRLLVVAALAGLVYLLGGDFAERATARTDKSLHRRQSAQRGGATGVAWTRRLQMPVVGTGPLAAVAWMQVTHSVRILPRYLLSTAAILGMVVIILFSVGNRSFAGDNATIWLIAATLYADFLVLLQLPVGMLGPLAQREMLKAMPISAWKVAVGQLAGPLSQLVALNSLILIAFIGFAPQHAGDAVSAAISAVPGAVLIAANVNLLAVWGILKPKAMQQRDALAAGRALVSVWVFFATLLPAIIPIVASVIVARTFEVGPALCAFVGAATTSVMCIPYVLALAWAFHRWQPSSYLRGTEDAEVQ